MCGANIFEHDTFLGLDPDSCTYDKSRVVLVRVPYDATASYMPGARNGPSAIFEASKQLEIWDLETKSSPCDLGIHSLPSIQPRVDNPESMLARVEEVCGKPFGDGKFVFTIGGDHSVTIGAAKACKSHHPEVSFLQVDAHLDFRDSYEGSPFSHACVGRRLKEMGKLVHVGARTASQDEMVHAKKEGLDPIWAQEVHDAKDENRREKWIKRVLDQLGPKVYVTVDVDALDPSVIRSTGSPFPGGLDWYQILFLLRAVGEKRDVVACDLVELAPSAGDHASTFASAQLVYKMIGYFA